MANSGSRSEEARRKSQERLFEDRQRAAEALKDVEKARLAQTAKTLRLRTLRLAKEAADREAAAEVKAVPAKRVRKKTTAEPEAA